MLARPNLIIKLIIRFLGRKYGKSLRKEGYREAGCEGHIDKRVFYDKGRNAPAVVLSRRRGKVNNVQVQRHVISSYKGL